MSDLEHEPALLFAYQIGPEGVVKIDWDSIRASPPGEGLVWIGLNRHAEESRRWLMQESGLHKLAAGALLAEETRPRVLHVGKGLVINLRGVNLNPGAEPEDMVSVRLWIEERRVISVQLRRLKALADVRGALAKRETTPENVGGLFTMIASRIVDRMEPVIAEDVNEIDAIEEESLEAPGPQLRSHLADLRRNAIVLRRYISPQRDVMSHLSSDQTAPFDDRSRLELREISDRVTRLTEELEAVRDRAVVVAEQLADRRAEEMNRIMMVLASVAAIFLPLGFLTGLLGINVGRLPGAESSYAFWVVVLLCLLIASGLALYFKRKDWL